MAERFSDHEQSKQPDRKTKRKAAALVLALAVAGWTGNSLLDREESPQPIETAEELEEEAINPSPIPSPISSPSPSPSPEVPPSPDPQVTESPEPIEEKVILSRYIAAGSPEMPCEPGEIIGRVETDQKIVALTINDGPSEETTPAILEVLDEMDATATFFFKGDRLETDEGSEIAKQVLEAGHEIGAHSYSDRLKDPTTNAQEHEKGNKVFEDIFGDPPFLYRAPGFNINDELKAKVTEAEQCFIGYSAGADTGDWRHDEAPEDQVQELLKKGDDAVIENLEPGKIISAHEETNDAEADGGMKRSRSYTAEHIEYLLKGIQDKGYTTVTVDTLLSERK